MKTLISVVFITIAISLFSQNAKIDSLQQRLNHATGNERILALNDLAYAYGYVDADKSINLAKEALQLAETQNYNKAKALTYDILGRAYFISGNYKIAEEYYNKCISTANKYGTKDDIYKALRHKTILYFNGYINNPSELIPVNKEYIQMTIEKSNYNDFQDGLKLFIYVSHIQQFKDSMISSYLIELEKYNTEKDEFLPAIYSCEAFYETLNLNYFKAIEKYNAALKLTKVVTNKISYLERIGTLYFDVRKYKESVIYLKDALQLITDKKNEPNNFKSFVIEVNLGASYMQLKDFKSAINSFNIALQCPFFSILDKSTLYNNIGMSYLSVDSLEKAESYLTKAISMVNTIKDPRAKLAILNSKAELLIKKKQLIQLTSVLDEISILLNEAIDYNITSDSYQILGNYYEISGNYQKSNEYLKKWIIANDSISNRDFVNKISELKFKYETEKKEQQISLQNSKIQQKDKLILLSIIAGGLIFVALLVIVILYRIRNKAYKQLVYQSLENTGKAQLVKIEGNADEKDTIEIKNANSVLDESLKNQIEISLNKQLDVKVYLEPNLLLKTLAEKCETNRSYLSQFINERYNLNFNTFINTLRINEAKHILSDKNNDIPFKELYLRLGFNTYSVFNEAFKRHVGVTPAFYLKTVKELFDSSNPKQNSVV